MISEEPYKPEDSANYWGYRYDVGHTDWNTEHVHPLVDKGMQVIGVDIAKQALDKFMTQSGQAWIETAVSSLGPSSKLFTRKDGKIKLYLGDFFKFTQDLEGMFDFVYDCDGLRVMDSELTPNYTTVIKSLMNPGGRLLLDAISYDKKILTDENFKPPMPVPPPHSVSVEDTKRLFEPGCTVKVIDQQPNNQMYGFHSVFHAYLIIKK